MLCALPQSSNLNSALMKKLLLAFCTKLGGVPCFFKAARCSVSGEYGGGIEGRFLLNAAQTPSTGTLNLLGAVKRDLVLGDRAGVL